MSLSKVYKKVATAGIFGILFYHQVTTSTEYDKEDSGRTGRDLK
jgi:hypothetical protein